MLRRMAAGLSVLLLAAAAAAQTSTVQRTVTTWGLLGTWAVDCKRPVGEQWTRLRYAATADGHVVREVDYGDPKRNDRLDVTTATIAKGNLLELAFYNNNSGQTRLLTLMKLPDKRIRAMAARVKDGEITVANGKFVATGNETPAQQKCD